MKKYASCSIALCLLSVALLNGCKADPNKFDYLDTTVAVTTEPLPWSNTGEFVYQTSAEDTVMVAPMEFMVLGNYLYAPFTYNAIDGDEATCHGSNNVLGDTESYSYCRIDLTTGEIYYIDTPL